MRIICLAALALAMCTAGISQAVSAEKIPAKQLFGKVDEPSKQNPASFGSYVKGCLAGAKMLPTDGPAWQAMRLHRNRNWAHPKMVNLVMKLATDSQKEDGWPGLLVGDLAQPRGGPMLSGHSSHQVGLDADIWLRPLPKKRFTDKEQFGADISATSMIMRGKDSRWIINKEQWKPGHVKLIKRAANQPGVSRIFIHPTIKKELCNSAGNDKSWLAKVRPWWGHHYHFHIRMDCPPGSAGCQNQPSPGADDGCGAQLDYWLKLINPKPGAKVQVAKKKPDVKKVDKRRQIVLADLPQACQMVLGKENIPAATKSKQAVPLPIRRPSVKVVKAN